MDDESEFGQQIRSGLAESAAQRTEAALRCFRAASLLQPASGLPYFLIGSEHAACGDAQAAEQAFATAVLHAPGLHVARYQLGLLQFSSGRASIALLTWQPLLALGEDLPFPHLVQGFIALAEDRLGHALAHWRLAMERCESNPALAADVARIMAAVAPLRGQEEAAGAGQHILVSAYGGGLH